MNQSLTAPLHMALKIIFQVILKENVVIVGMGAFAIENMRTAFENGAKHITNCPPYKTRSPLNVLV